MAEVFVAAGRTAWAHFLPVDGVKVRDGAFDDVDGFVAEEGGTVVGFAIVKDGELDMLYAAPTVWGCGVGPALITAALDALRTEGRSQATLWTAEENARSRAAYERYGWRPDGTTQEGTYAGVTFTQMRYRIDL